MTGTAYERVTRALAEVTRWQPPNDKGDWLCPAHNDRSPSLSVNRGNKGVVLKCQAGCDTTEILRRLNLTMSDLFDEGRNGKPDIVATYDYVDEDGRLLFQVVRMVPKNFLQRRPAGDGWEWRTADTRKVLYRLPHILEAVQRGMRVFVVEGEKDVHAIEGAGGTATCNAGGAGKWRDEYARVLSGADVVVVADKDEAGRKHARQVAASLNGIAASVLVAEARTGKDVADHLAAGHSLDDLVVPGETSVEKEPTDDEETDLLRIAIRGASNRARIRGGTFILDAPERVEAIWGDDDAVAWPEGEPMMVNGPTGVGKTTIAQQVVLGRVGIRSEVLGMPVKQTANRVLYVAADRPKQVARSFRRMVGEEHREVLDERIEVWRGPLPKELTKDPELLVVMAEEFGADTIVLDSLKDIAAKLSDDETANRLNHAFQLCSVADIELLVLHHQRKAQGDNKKPNGIADVFGSTWITAGMGSVLLVWGEPGDPVVEVSHLKQPAEPIGPLTVMHDHTAGISTVEAGVDLLSLVRTSTGLTAEGAARALFRKDKVDRNQTLKAKRKLESLVNKGLIVAREQGRSQVTGQQMPTRFYAVKAEE